MKQAEITIQGMSCNHCVMAVKKELAKLDGVTVQSVEVGKAAVEFAQEQIEAAKIGNAIQEAGFQMTALTVK